MSFNFSEAKDDFKRLNHIQREQERTSSNFLALYWSAPFRKFRRMMSQSTVPWIIEHKKADYNVTGYYGYIVTVCWYERGTWYVPHPQM